MKRENNEILQRLMNKANEEVLKQEFLISRAVDHTERGKSESKLEEAKLFKEIILKEYQEALL